MHEPQVQGRDNGALSTCGGTYRRGWGDSGGSECGQRAGPGVPRPRICTGAGDQGRLASSAGEKRESGVPGTQRGHRKVRGWPRHAKCGQELATDLRRGGRGVLSLELTKQQPDSGGVRREGRGGLGKPVRTTRGPPSCRPVRSRSQASLAGTQARLSSRVYAAAPLQRTHRALSPSPREMASAALRGSRDTEHWPRGPLRPRAWVPATPRLRPACREFGRLQAGAPRG